VGWCRRYHSVWNNTLRRGNWGLALKILSSTRRYLWVGKALFCYSGVGAEALSDPELRGMQRTALFSALRPPMGHSWGLYYSRPARLFT